MGLSPDGSFSIHQKDTLPFYKSLIEGTTDLVWVVDSEQFKLLVCNQSFSQYCAGRGIQLIPGMTPDEMMPGENSKTLANIYHRAVCEGAIRVEYPVFSGEIILQLFASPMYINDDVVGISVFAHDIPYFKTVEQKMQLVKEQYNVLVESTRDMIWAVDADQHKLLIFNSTLKNYFFQNSNIDIHVGNIPEEIMTETQALFYHGLYERAIDSGAFQMEYSTEEDEIDLVASFTPLVLDGDIIGVTVFAKDVTAENKFRHELEVSNEILTKRFIGTVTALSKIAELRDPFMSGHQKRVQQLACAIAGEMGLPDKTINCIFLGAMVHDIGKLYIAPDTLNKTGKITSQEFQIMQTHAEKGYLLVNEMDLPWQIPTMIYQHHERLDGSGYPLGLSGDQIILESRILAVADVVEAMTANRPYRPARGIHEALEEIRQNRGFRYDSKAVDACIEIFEDKRFKFS